MKKHVIAAPASPAVEMTAVRVVEAAATVAGGARRRLAVANADAATRSIGRDRQLWNSYESDRSGRGVVSAILWADTHIIAG